MGQVPVFIESVAINDECFRAQFQCIDGTVHSCDAGPQDIHFVNLTSCNHSNGPCQGIALYLTAQCITLPCRELL